MIWLLIWFSAAVVTPIYMKEKGGSVGAGIALGLILGWIGFLIAVAICWNKDVGTCPMCGEKVKLVARICKHCGTKFQSRPGGEPVFQPRPVGGGIKKKSEPLKTCHKCGEVISPTYMFCKICGAKVHNSTPKEAPSMDEVKGEV